MTSRTSGMNETGECEKVIRIIIIIIIIIISHLNDPARYFITSPQLCARSPVCRLAYLKNYTSKSHRIFRTCYL